MTLTTMSRATLIVALALAPALALGGSAALAQETGSMAVRLGGEDRSFVILPQEDGTRVEDGDGGLEVVLVAAPDDADSLGPREGDGTPRLTVAFVVAGMGSDVASTEPRIVLSDGDGGRFASTEGLTTNVTVSSFTEIGETFVATGDFSAELAPEEGGEGVGVSGSFQATIEGG